MQYDADSPAEYLSMLADDWRKTKLLEVRALLKKHAPHLKETIQYKMLSYADDAGGLFALNAQKDSVTFYVGNASKVDTTGELLKGLKSGKGCVKFGKTVSVADTRFGEFVKKAMAMRQRGEDFGC
jgi:uncharacterized protein YdhG (YjbR/CyaY superfamily)